MSEDTHRSKKRVRETYVAAIQHDIFDAGDATLVGVVRRPTGWFDAAVDENVPELAPSESLLEETKEKTGSLKQAGMCDEGAHNAAWEECDFAGRFRAEIDDSEAAQAALDSLVRRVESGETIALVCFEGESKRCHRHILVEKLKSRIDG